MPKEFYKACDARRERPKKHAVIALQGKYGYKDIVVTSNRYPISRFKIRYKGGSRVRLKPSILRKPTGSSWLVLGDLTR